MNEDRLKHSVGVSRKMVEIGRRRGLDDDELHELFVLGYNHDIGYEFGDNESHAKIGGLLLKKCGYKYWREIYYHGDPNASFQSSYLEILNLADMQIDKEGNEVGFVERLNDIRKRYGVNSNAYMNASDLINKLNKDQ